MKDYLRLTHLIALLTLPACLTYGSVVIRDWQFSDASGTNLNVASSTGAETGSWAGSGWARTQQNGSLSANVLNFGYTANWKWTAVDTAAGSIAFRTFTFDTTLTSAAYTTYSFDVDLRRWDLRQNWDPANASAADKGIGFRIEESTGDNIVIGFDTQGATGFRAFSNGTGVSFTQVNGGAFTNALNRFEAEGGFLRITGDLTTGNWTASANDGEGGVYQTILSGTGITDIASFSMFSKSPSAGSWGGAGAGEAVDPTVGGTAGDFVLVDSMNLTAVAVVPEPSAYALYAGLLVLGLILYRRRRV
jgi:hypothetical protein